MKKFRKLCKSLLAAAAGSAATMVSDPVAAAANPRAALRSAAAGAAVGVLLYFARSPLHQEKRERHPRHAPAPADKLAA